MCSMSVTYSRKTPQTVIRSGGRPIAARRHASSLKIAHWCYLPVRTTHCTQYVQSHTYPRKHATTFFGFPWPGFPATGLGLASGSILTWKLVSKTRTVRAGAHDRTIIHFDALPERDGQSHRQTVTDTPPVVMSRCITAKN